MAEIHVILLTNVTPKINFKNKTFLYNYSPVIKIRKFNINILLLSNPQCIFKCCHLSIQAHLLYVVVMCLYPPLIWKSPSVCLCGV